MAKATKAKKGTMPPCAWCGKPGATFVAALPHCGGGHLRPARKAADALNEFPERLRADRLASKLKAALMLLAAKRRLLKEARAVIESVEFHQQKWNGHPECPSCANFQDDGHTEDCDLEAMLVKLGKR